MNARVSDQSSHRFSFKSMAEHGPASASCLLQASRFCSLRHLCAGRGIFLRLVLLFTSEGEALHRPHVNTHGLHAAVSRPFFFSVEPPDLVIGSKIVSTGVGFLGSEFQAPWPRARGSAERGPHRSSSTAAESSCHEPCPVQLLQLRAAPPPPAPQTATGQCRLFPARICRAPPGGSGTLCRCAACAFDLRPPRLLLQAFLRAAERSFLGSSAPYSPRLSLAESLLEVDVAAVS